MSHALSQRFGTGLLPIDQFPGWDSAPAFIESIAADENCRKIADVGGGANPVVSPRFVREHAVDYCLMDISREELNKAPSHYTSKICVDVCSDSGKFFDAVGRTDFDLVFSHMFLEHIRNPVQVHKNLHVLLKRNGIAVHMYPSANNLPLTLNRVLPERITRAMVRIAQPHRDLDGQYGKFPAYYRMCGNPNPRLRSLFEQIGYAVVAHTGFIGHWYYKRIPGLNKFELMMRQLLLKYRIGMTSVQLLVLRKE